MVNSEKLNKTQKKKLQKKQRKNQIMEDIKNIILIK